MGETWSSQLKTLGPAFGTRRGQSSPLTEQLSISIYRDLFVLSVTGDYQPGPAHFDTFAFDEYAAHSLFGSGQSCKCKTVSSAVIADSVI